VRRRFSINKAGRICCGSARLLPSEERVSQEDFLDRVSETAACTRSLSGPDGPARRKHLGAFSSQASTEAAVPWLTNVRHGKTLSALPFPSAKGRGVRLIFCLTACQCVSLAFRSGEHPRQLPALSIESHRKSVAAITLRGDPGQASSRRRFVPDITGLATGRSAESAYFSRATTNSGAQSSARFISESGKVQMALLADSAYWAARLVAASTDP